MGRVLGCAVELSEFLKLFNNNKYLRFISQQIEIV